MQVIEKLLSTRTEDGQHAYHDTKDQRNAKHQRAPEAELAAERRTILPILGLKPASFGPDASQGDQGDTKHRRDGAMQHQEVPVHRSAPADRRDEAGQR